MEKANGALFFGGKDELVSRKAWRRPATSRARRAEEQGRLRERRRHADPFFFFCAGLKQIASASDAAAVLAGAVTNQRRRGRGLESLLCIKAEMIALGGRDD